MPGWNIIANYALTDAFVSQDNDIPEGDRLAGIPEHTASLWTTYEIQSGDLQGLGFGLGLVFVDEREAELPNTGVTLPSYFRTDARLFYRRDNWRAAVNIKIFSMLSITTRRDFYYPSSSVYRIGKYCCRVLIGLATPHTSWSISSAGLS